MKDHEIQKLFNVYMIKRHGKYFKEDKDPDFIKICRKLFYAGIRAYKKQLENERKQ